MSKQFKVKQTLSSQLFNYKPIYIIALTLLSSFALNQQALAESEPLIIAPTINTTNTTDTEVSNSAQEVVVTQKRIQSLLKDALQTTTVEKTEKNTHDIADTLSQVGVEFSRAGGAGQQASIFMRSANSNHTLMLLNGVPFNDVSNGAPAIYLLNPQAFTQTEVVLGNISSIYGSNAMGGVINLINRPNLALGQNQLSVNAQTSNRHQHAYNLNLASKQGDAQQNLTSQVQFYQQYDKAQSAIDTSVIKTSNADKDIFKQTGLQSHLRYNHGLHEFGFNGLYQKSDIDYDSPYSKATLYFKDNIEHNHIYGNMRFGDISNNHLLQIKLDAANSKHDYDNYQNHALKEILKQKQHYLSTQISILPKNLGNGQSFTLAHEALKQTIDAQSIPQSLYSRNYTTKNRTTHSLRANYNIDLAPWHLQANVRRDMTNQNNPDANTYLLGMAYDINPQLQFGISHSTAFKLPSFNDLYIPVWGANEALKPEKSRSNELYLRYQGNNWHTRTSFYANNYKDLIIYNNSTYQLNNVDKAKIYGVEQLFSVNQAHWRADLQLNYAYPSQQSIDSKGQTQNSLLLKRARLYGQVDLAYKTSILNKAAQFGVKTKFNSQKVDYGNQKLSGYGLVDIYHHLDVTPNLNLRLDLQNAFNKKASNVYGYHLPARTLFLRLNYKGNF